MALEAARIGARKRKPIRTKRVPIDLAKIIADLAGARVGVLELQNRLRNLARHRAHLDGAAVVGGEVGLGVGARAGGELLDGAAVGHAAVVFALAADVEVDGEGAVVAHVRLALCAGGGVDLRDGGSAGDDGGGGHGCSASIIGRRGGGEGWDGEVSHGYKGGDDGCWETHCWYGGLFLVALRREGRSCKAGEGEALKIEAGCSETW